MFVRFDYRFIVLFVGCCGLVFGCCLIGLCGCLFVFVFCWLFCLLLTLLVVCWI